MPYGVFDIMNPRGRPKGSRNKTSMEIAAVARQLVESREYKASLKKRLGYFSSGMR
jgi:hypothetical protein